MQLKNFANLKDKKQRYCANLFCRRVLHYLDLHSNFQRTELNTK